MVTGVPARVRCAFVGDLPLVEQCAEIAREHGLEVVLIATDNDLVRAYASAAGIAVAPTAELGDGLAGHDDLVLLSIANLHTVPDDVRSRVRMAINLHEGPLPRYGGLNTTSWAILAGETEHAITWHLVTAEPGGGDVVATETFPVGADDTAFSLNARAYEAALATFPTVAREIAAGSVGRRPQPPGERRVFDAHERPALLFDPAAPAAEVRRAVRALNVGHWLRNTIGSVRLVRADDVFVVDRADLADSSAGAAPGDVVAVDQTEVRVATSTDDVVLTLSTTRGSPVVASDVLQVGERLLSPPAELVEAIRRVEPQLAPLEDFWLDRLAATEPTAAPLTSSAGAAQRAVSEVDVPPGCEPDVAVAAVAGWLARLTGEAVVSFAVVDGAARRLAESVAPLASRPIVTIAVDEDATFAAVHDLAAAELAIVRERGTFLHDAVGRDPRTRGRTDVPPVVVEVGASTTLGVAGTAALHVTFTGARVRVDAAVPPDDADVAARIAAQLASVLECGLRAPSTAVADLPLLTDVETAALDAVNDTAVEHDRAATVDGAFGRQVDRTPDAPALSFGATTLTYAELQAAARQLARRLAAGGIGRGDRVGIAVERGPSMVIGVLATLQLGAAYLPLDPTYPVDRLGFMVEDAGIQVLLASDAIASALAGPGIAAIDPDVPDGTKADGEPHDELHGEPHDASDLAYVIYTSGSTGVPKGVMLEHRQVANFFVAMDRVIDHDPPGVWLSVTSLSFDISVLELLWTLTRGFHVVLKADRGVPAVGAATERAPTRPVSFSLFYFAAGEETAGDGYRLLLDSARFADRNGFEAVWTPERHFHAFGGAYPNPSVTGAALAAVTTKVGIRAGSVVLPLHSPIRVAEEWAVVDNLARGRVAISFAAGWQPDDFVLNPAAYASAKSDLPASIELVRRLWRGETVAMPGHDGSPVSVRTLPRPVQPELPVWLTSAGSPSTFERAGTLGVNLLTHLLGQTVDQLAANIERYRTARRDAGHPGEGRVTLMLHTYLDRDGAVAREVAREPMKSYLRTAVGLLRDVASAFPIYRDSGKSADDLFASMSEEEMDQLLEMAAQRYLHSSGLFGTAEDAVQIVERVAAAGVDEVACLIDFGVGIDDVFRSLHLLLDAKSEVDRRRTGADDARPAVPSAAAVEADLDDAMAALTVCHGVTHLQCTPSLAAMLVADPADRAALGRIDHLMVGGEALPTALAAELRKILPARFTNMYGPTETTIWSLTHELDEVPDGPVPIGRPIANTDIFVLDPAGRRLPLGAFGELHIGGEGVARGYHDRPELTAARFVERPGMGRVYATGDVVRLHPAGHVEFAGRADNQVKVRGHRIELGEIETVLDAHPDVVQSVVVAAEVGGDTRLVAHVMLHGGATASPESLREHVAATLPDVMVPSAVVPTDSFPLTPNGKVDRKRLREAPVAVAVEDEPVAAPADDTEQLVADVWRSELGRSVGRDDNFFDIGGHSLLAVKVFRRLVDASGASLALTDVFRFPTVRTFAAHLTTLRSGPAEATSAAATTPSGADRGAMRRRALTRRRGGDDDDR